MHVNAVSMYIPTAMLNYIQEQVLAMSQLMAQLGSGAYAPALSYS